MGSVFTGRTGLPTRTKALLALLVLIVIGAGVVIYLRRSADPTGRLAEGEWTPQDVDAFRDNPEGWINLVGEVMLERATEGDATHARALSRFMIETIESLDGDLAQYAQPVAWMHGAAVQSPAVSGALAAWLADVGAGTPLRLRVACAGFGDVLGQPGNAPLATALAQVLVAGGQLTPEVDSPVATRCEAVLRNGFAVLLEGAPDPVLAQYVQQLFDLFGVRAIGYVVTTYPRSVRALELVSRVLDDRAEALVAAGEDARASSLEDWREEHIVPVVVATLDETPASNPELWQPVDDYGNPRALLLLVDALGELEPMAWYLLMDRLYTAAPGATRDPLGGLHAQAEEGAREVVRTALAPLLESCAALTSSPVELTVALERRGLSVRGNSPSPARACLERGLVSVTLPEHAALMRPLTLSVTVGAIAP